MKSRRNTVQRIKNILLLKEIKSQVNNLISRPITPRFDSGISDQTAGRQNSTVLDTLKERNPVFSKNNSHLLQ